MCYQEKIRAKSLIRFVGGAILRFKKWCVYEQRRKVARSKGASVGKESIITKQLAKKANINLHIGNHTSIQTSKIDTRGKITIGNYVIIGSNVEIVTASHNIDSPDWELKIADIVIEDYVWIATNALILPSVRKIGRGSVIGAGSCIVRDVEPMSVVSGNPACEIRKRQCIHSNLVVESLLCGDYKAYLNARFI